MQIAAHIDLHCSNVSCMKSVPSDLGATGLTSLHMPPATIRTGTTLFLALPAFRAVIRSVCHTSLRTLLGQLSALINIYLGFLRSSRRIPQLYFQVGCRLGLGAFLFAILDHFYISPSTVHKPLQLKQSISHLK